MIFLAYLRGAHILAGTPAGTCTTARCEVTRTDTNNAVIWASVHRVWATGTQQLKGEPPASGFKVHGILEQLIVLQVII